MSHQPEYEPLPCSETSYVRLDLSMVVQRALQAAARRALHPAAPSPSEESGE